MKGKTLSLSAAAPRLQVVMGVAGSGKTTVAVAWAKAICAAFIEGDDCHPQTNIDKMSRGEALNDDDRWPWLDIFAQELSKLEGTVVGTCSALKASYRRRIVATAGEPVLFIYLHGSRHLIGERLTARQGHFMPPDLLDSQFATLEVPSTSEIAITAEIDSDIKRITKTIYEEIQARFS